MTTPAASDVTSEKASRLERSIALTPGRCAASTLVAWPRPTLVIPAVTRAVTVMKATLPRPDGPSPRARSRAATRKPAARTTLATKSRAEPSATETGALAEWRDPAAVAGGAGSDTTPSPRRRRVEARHDSRAHRTEGASVLFPRTITLV